MKCDFCGSPEVVWAYPASDFLADTGTVESLGAWCACEPCKMFIDGGDLETLNKRALTQKACVEAAKLIGWKEVARMTAAFHQKFMKHKLGEGEPVNLEEVQRG